MEERSAKITRTAVSTGGHREGKRHCGERERGKEKSERLQSGSIDALLDEQEGYFYLHVCFLVGLLSFNVV